MDSPDDPSPTPPQAPLSGSSRRAVLGGLVGAAGALALSPFLSSCSSDDPAGPASPPGDATSTTRAPEAATAMALGPDFRVVDRDTLKPVAVDRTIVRALVGNDHTEIYALADGITVDRDVWVPTRGGPRLAANVFRPETAGRYPVVMSCTAYEKDLHPLDYTLRGRGPTNRSIGLDMGDMRISEATPFEAADPGYWVTHDFVVVHIDALGTGRSEGEAGLGLSGAVVEAFADGISWAADQPWSNGRVGLVGVSYLAAVQWRIAELRPRGLAAIIPWEGFTDVFADVAVHGGIPETSFLPWWLAGDKDTPPGSDDPPTFHAEPAKGIAGTADFITALQAGVTPLRADFPISPPDLRRITVPALVCASWSAQGLHSRGAFNGYREISSDDKYLYTHGQHEWTASNSRDALDHQRAFLDRYLADRSEATPIPPVRLEVRRTRDDFEVRWEDSFPPASATSTRFHLDATEATLVLGGPAASGSTTYLSTDVDQSARFTFTFERDTEICGPAALRLWASTDAGSDLDMFVALRKFDAAGDHVPFWNMLNREDIVTRGWIRASQRALDTAASEPLRPVLAYTGSKPVAPGEIMELNIEVLPSCTLFEAGTTLMLELKGSDIVRTRLQQHLQLYNQGNHTVWSGSDHPSHLLLPIVER